MWRGVIAAVVVGGCSFQLSVGMSIDDAPVDAAIDAPIDAFTSTCSTAGLVCPSGTAPRLIPCTPVGGCWVGCSDGAAIDHAAGISACAAWGGKLGWIDSGAEGTCLRTILDGAIMLGLEQSALAATPGMGWTWNGDIVPPLYLNWAPGQPNDNDGTENGVEQCAYSSTSVTWQDEPCTVTHTRFTCRR